MARITCSDLGFACGHLLQHETDEELVALAREHAREDHGEEIDDERIVEAIRHDE